MTIRAEAQKILPELIALRRELHGMPEIGLSLPRTQKRVLEALEPLDLEITLGISTTSITAVLRGGKPGPVVLLRGDMDGLPVTEETGLEFAARNGCMHACGHDLHTAGLVGAARLLAAHRDELCGSVIFMFQPGEEGYGGAKVMLDEGLLDAAGQRPVAAYAIHVGPGPLGEFRTRSGAMLAGSNNLYTTVYGRGGHGSAPQFALDPVPPLVDIAAALQSMVTRSFSVFDPIVLSITQLSAGQAINVIPDSASLGATVRTLSAESVARVARESQRVAEGIAAAYGCRAETVFDAIYPVTVNNSIETKRAFDILESLFGPDKMVELDGPSMGSEDFSFVLDEVPGCFLMLGCSPADQDSETVVYNHSPRIIFDDSVLGDQAAALATLARERLKA